MNKFMRMQVSRGRLLITLLLSVIGFVVVAGFALPGVFATTDIGYRDFSFPSGLADNSEPTGEKPESKLWWNDGFWWGSLWSTTQATPIAFTGWICQHRAGSTPAQRWTIASTAGPTSFGMERSSTSSPTMFAKNEAALPAPAGERGELFRYSYNPATDIYTLDGGFPVEVTLGKSETLVIDKDSLGTLWVTYVEDSQVMVNHSLNGNDATWGTCHMCFRLARTLGNVDSS